MRTRPLFSALALGIPLGLLSACASAPVRFYTLAPSATEITASQQDAPVTYVPRLSLPDYLDTQDILTRDSSALTRSSNGRWASRLSQSATDLIVARLSQDNPHRMITGYPPLDTPASRLSVTIERMDLTQQGEAALVASWTDSPREESHPARQGRTQISVKGSVTDDAAKTALLQKLFEQLADRISPTLATD